MKKIEETKETVKSTEFATTIYRIRQERKLTQKEIEIGRASCRERV